MIERLDELVTFLADDVGVADIDAWLGKAALHGSVSTYPADYAVAGKPYLVRIEPSEPVALADLRRSFGDYRQNRSDRGRPREVIFYPADRGGPFTVAVVATVEGTGDLAAASTRTLMFRRDPRGDE